MNGWESLVSLLAEANAHDVGCGEVVLEDNSDVGIDWGTASSAVISVHINAGGRIGFAALIDGWKAHGSSETHIPDELIVAFRKLAAMQMLIRPHPPSAQGRARYEVPMSIDVRRAAEMYVLRPFVGRDRSSAQKVQAVGQHAELSSARATRRTRR
jgi:hypothetical protein